ncbi:hypothetical protein BU24DRAFT_289046 [Aaosphaeria arxii CBS 175.79]|uniref:F-box domain-containing protein n=1 Tax=Aaosphaeria arxii CBS 175.79 TaxID=1450172 RepID=A0A6A5XFS7_9PLEO|nr:uncharacterized protein BU24DRAFT_289046 [Aaosphaeria arxii CBS 175.79]KAF2011783.1 hypothetical protein BU24DRAFT_289046 [Aaosphaeria arxii CBS 175.79]
MAGVVDKKLSLLSQSSEDFSRDRQSLLLSELELLLDLRPSALRSNLLVLPRELREVILGHVLPELPEGARPELHTCLWSADMQLHDAWRHDIFGYDTSVPMEYRIHPSLLSINKQLHDELLMLYFQRSRLTLHAELRNSKDDIWHFESSPHILQLPMLKHVTHVQFYVEWNYIVHRAVDPIQDQIRMINNLVQAMDKLLSPIQAVQTIELSILCFWRWSSSKYYSLSMQNLFDLEDVFKRHGESRWTQILRTSTESPNPSAGVGYRLSSENKVTEQSGGIHVYISQDLENAMRPSRKSTVDFYGNYEIGDPLPQPAYRHGAMF